jgi:hypothetical protein
MARVTSFTRLGFPAAHHFRHHPPTPPHLPARLVTKLSLTAKRHVDRHAPPEKRHLQPEKRHAAVMAVSQFSRNR